MSIFIYIKNAAVYIVAGDRVCMRNFSPGLKFLGGRFADERIYVVRGRTHSDTLRSVIGQLGIFVCVCV